MLFMLVKETVGFAQEQGEGAFASESFPKMP